MLQSKCTNTLLNNHLKNILLAPKQGQIGARGCRGWMTNYAYLETKGGGCASSNEPMPLQRQSIHDLHGQTVHRQFRAHRIGWIHQSRRQPMQQLHCTGITPSFPRLRCGSILENILLVPLVCIIANYA